jgi:hypothetical protein
MLLTASIARQYYRGIPGTARVADRRFIRQSRPGGWVTSDLSFDGLNSRFCHLLAECRGERWTTGPRTHGGFIHLSAIRSTN